MSFERRLASAAFPIWLAALMLYLVNQYMVVSWYNIFDSKLTVAWIFSKN